MNKILDETDSSLRPASSRSASGAASGAGEAPEVPPMAIPKAAAKLAGLGRACLASLFSEMRALPASLPRDEKADPESL